MRLKTALLVTTTLICGTNAALAQEGPLSEPAADTPDPTTIIVKGKKKDVVKKLDKTVYSTANNPTADSGTAQDVLQSTPTVSVSAGGDISVQGNKNVTVLVNGKPSTAMMGESRAVTLQTMSGSDIASVEVITNPSAAYSANGGAIVNIVLKKDRKPGAHGSVRGNMSDQGLWNITAAGDYTRNKLSLHATAGIRRDGSLKFRQSDVHWTDPLTGGFGENSQSSEVFIRRTTWNASISTDYDLSETDTLSASASYNFRRSRPYFDEFHADYYAGTPTDTYHRISNGPNQQSDNSFGLSYSHQKDDIVLKAGAQHSDTDILVDKSAGNVYIYPVQPTAYNRIANRNGLHMDQANFDYARPFGATGQVSFGLFYEKTRNDIDNYFAGIDPVTSAETVDGNITHRYRVIETLKAGYVTGQMTWAEKWEALFGVRLESTNTRLDAEHQSPIPDGDFLAVNPSLHLKYTFSSKKYLKLSYSQSQQRPDPRDMSPYATYWDAQNVFIGNPNLKPQNLKALELVYETDRDRLSRNLGLFYRTSRDTVIDVRSVTADGAFLNSKANSGSGLSAGVDASLAWDVSDAFHLSADGSAYFVRLEALDLDGLNRQSGTSYSANLNLNYSKGKDVLTFDAHLQGPGLTPQGTYSATNTLNLTWKHHLTKRLDLNMNIRDLLNGSKQSYTNRTSTYYQRGYDHFDVRRVFIGFVYKVG
ncbi:TonB-dependent receptor [Asticcacaulis benevestitus]|uniref:TonB-dependent receptor n=1 Tax=Asticcacaulis benevestitus TaxID=347481 RepID=UPI0009D95E5C|nr:outer membrane beta-barrel family protein [Asticcacaulis benevestitus]